MSIIDSVEFAQDLIRCPSITPIEGGALDVMQNALEGMGFTCHRLTFEEEGTEPVQNLYARLGDQSPNFAFSGHTDVVPIGDEAAWSFDPFGGEIKDGWLCGRGAADMKGGIAGFVGAVSRYLDTHGAPKGSISLLITGDEEAVRINGTKKLVDWLKERGEEIACCVIGEPTNPSAMGDMIKIGRRGTMTFSLTVEGVQGHVAYPHLADNPLPKLVALLSALDALVLDEGTDHFQPSNLEIVNLDVGNKVDNIIPARATARFNVRFNVNYTSQSLEQKIRETLDQAGHDYTLEGHASAEPVFTEPGQLSDILSRAVEKVTGRVPELTTTGGASDSCFFKDYCPVVEFGVVGQTMHKVDEKIEVTDLTQLTDIYYAMLEEFFLSQK